MLPNNIAALRKARGLSQTDLATRVGTTLNMLGKLERGGRNLTSSWITKLADALNVAPHTILSADAPALPAPQKPEPADEDTVEIISLDLSLSMGPGTLIEEFIEEERVRFSLRMIQAITRTPSDRLRLVRGIGDSMEPTLRTGDRVLVDINDRQLTRMNGIYWVDHLGTHGLKRLRAAGRGRVAIQSDNPMVADFEADAEDVRIEGRAIWFARDL